MRHFLACLSKDAEGEETIVNIEINGEKVIFVFKYAFISNITNYYFISFHGFQISILLSSYK